MADLKNTLTQVGEVVIDLTVKDNFDRMMIALKKDGNPTFDLESSYMSKYDIVDKLRTRVNKEVVLALSGSAPTTAALLDPNNKLSEIAKVEANFDILEIYINGLPTASFDPPLAPLIDTDTDTVKIVPILPYPAVDPRRTGNIVNPKPGTITGAVQTWLLNNSILYGFVLYGTHSLYYLGKDNIKTQLADPSKLRAIVGRFLAKGNKLIDELKTTAKTVLDNTYPVVSQGVAPENPLLFSGLRSTPRKSCIYLYSVLKTSPYNFSEFAARAILGIVSKESGFVPKNEYGYGGTKWDRITHIWPYLASLWPLNTGEALQNFAKDNVKFYDLIYGYQNPFKGTIVGLKTPPSNFPGATGAANYFGPDKTQTDNRFKTAGYYGNNQPGDGYKYRGRGYNGLTFKGSYDKFNKDYQALGSPGGTADIIDNPDKVNELDSTGNFKLAAHFCALYFKDRKASANLPEGTQADATFSYMRYNAGVGSPPTGNIFEEGLGKASSFVASLPATLPAA